MNVSLFIARRLSLKRDETGGTPGDRHRRSPAVGIAVAGIALSITIMLLTLAIVPGFKHQITRKVMGFDAQVTMHPLQSGGSYEGLPSYSMIYTPALDSMIKSSLPPEAEVSVSVRQPGILKTDDQFAGLVFKGFEAGMFPSFISENLESGVIPDYTADSTLYHIIISRSVADDLALNLGDRLNAYFFTEGNIRARRLTVAGIYNSFFNEFDRLMAFMSIDALRPIASMEEGHADAVEIRSLPVDFIPEATHLLMTVATEAFYNNNTNCYLSVNDVYSRNPMYFNWLDLLDTNVVVIMALMAIVSAVTLISCLFIMILERVRLIGVLKALGADNTLVSRVFLFMAERVVLRGILIGDAAGLLLVWLQWQFRLLPLDPEAYYLSAVPVEFNWTGIILLNVGAIIISLAIMLLPTRMVARISPVKVMKFE